MEEERRGTGVQPPVWLRRPGRRRHGENGQRVEDGTRAIPLRGRIHPGEPVSHNSCQCGRDRNILGSDVIGGENTAELKRHADLITGQSQYGLIQ